MRGANDRDLGSGLAMSPGIMSSSGLVARRSHVHMLDGCACRLWRCGSRGHHGLLAGPVRNEGNQETINTPAITLYQN